MEIYLEKEDKTVKKDFEGKAKDLLKELEVNPETVIIVKKGELITEEDILQNDDKIRLLSVVSGG